MKLLIIGGTRFVGRALVEEAKARGHELTLFNRGQSNPDLYPNVETIVGDRDGGLEGLNDGSWDGVIDTCGYIPRLTRDSATRLAGRVPHYTFISTISVYESLREPNIDESAALGTLEDESVEEVTNETYGPLKVLCERSIDEAMNGRASHIRAGLIVGPHDQTDRFTYWPCRIDRGGEVLAPDSPSVKTQFIDVRDLAAFAIKATEEQRTGAFNCTGPDYPLTLGGLFEMCQATSGSDTTLTWASEAFLLKHDVTPFSDLPLWIPSEYKGFNTVNNDKAQAAGLTYRPLKETVADTLAWAKARPDDYEWRAGLSPEREAELLKLWHETARAGAQDS